MNEALPIPRFRESDITAENLSLSLIAPDDNDGTADLMPPSIINHIHAYTEFIVCRQSGVSFCLEEQEIRLNPFDLVMIPAGVLHHIRSPYDPDLYQAVGIRLRRRRMACGTDLYGMAARVCRAGGVRIWPGMTDACARIRNIIDQTSSADGLMRLDAPLQMLSLLIHLSGRSDFRELPVSFFPESSGEIDRAAQLEQLLNNYFDRDLTLTSVAARLFISPSQLNRITHRIYGMTFHRMLTDCRLSAAEDLLRMTDLPASAIALKVGFSSPSGFYEAFHARCGMTPTAFRRRGL